MWEQVWETGEEPRRSYHPSCSGQRWLVRQNPADPRAPIPIKISEDSDMIDKEDSLECNWLQTAESIQPWSKE